MRELRYEEQPSELRDRYPTSRVFASIDPGNYGAIVAWEDDGQYAFHRMIDADLTASARVLAEVIRYHGARLLVVENQFVRLNPRMSLQMAQRIGLILGMAAAWSTFCDDVQVVWIQPKTWQVVLAPNEKANRKELERRSLAGCPVPMPELVKAERTGVAAAYHIGRFWKRRMKWEGL